jgi:hypothetical protein
MSRTPRPLAALAMLALIVAGCSNASAGTDSSGGNDTAANHEKAVKFAECMRDNGVGSSRTRTRRASFATGRAGLVAGPEHRGVEEGHRRV